MITFVKSAMKLNKVLIIMLIMTTIVVGKIPSREHPPVNLAMADTSVVNPNGASELALLMRQMQEYSSSEKKRVLSQREPSAMPRSFEKLSTAKITTGMRKSDNYDKFAGMYLDQVRTYMRSEEGAERVSVYNNMIASCLACHSEHCPGPVPVISKLIIKGED